MWDKERQVGAAGYRPPTRYPAVAAPSGTNVAEKARTEPQLPKETAALPQNLDPKVLQQALHDLSSHVQNLQRSLQFSVDRESGETVVKIVDTETHEVIRQIPSEELLVITHRMHSTAGSLVAEKV